MSKVLNKRKPRKSLRTLLIIWFVAMSVVPLAFLTAFSLSNYKGAIDQELNERISGNHREVQVVLNEYESELSLRNRTHSEDKRLVYFLNQGRFNKVRELATAWMGNHFAHQMSIFSQDGRLEVALFRDENGDIRRFEKLEGRDVYLSDRFLKNTAKKDHLVLTDFSSGRNLDLIAFSVIRSPKGGVVGFVEEIVKIDSSFLNGLKKRFGLELMFFDLKNESRVATDEDLLSYPKNFFADILKSSKGRIFEISLKGVPFGVVVSSASWGEDRFYVALGASKAPSNSVLKRIQWAFVSVVGTIVTILILLSFFITKIILGPLNNLVDTIENLDVDSGPVEIQNRSENELGVLTESFNEMSSRVFESQNELKQNIKKLEAANAEIRDTQAKLVHAAKMASLGQLVAGIAHELNNPISFIYSNMGHLKEYSDKLVELVKKASLKTDMSQEKDEAEFDYIVKDMPKLIHSCEEGARRTRDIVVGLRNFSRLEEAKVKEVDIHKGIDDTLALLEGEFKGRIQITKDYGQNIPLILCYPSQLNQVFMNILSNAAHAIESEGEIKVSTRMQGSHNVEISIKDTGKGMDKETQEKIFDPFFTTKGVSKGTGLGMSISYGIIQKHGGDISLKSQLGQGTEFLIHLPIRA